MSFWKTLQTEVHAWSVENFGDNPEYRQILGIIEELGELDNASTPVQRADAVGDTMIYMADYCARTDRSLEDVVSLAQRGDMFILSKLMGSLAHHELKREQNIRLSENHRDAITSILGHIVFYLSVHASILPATVALEDYSLEGVVRNTWRKVQLRNWKKNKENGGEHGI